MPQLAYLVSDLQQKTSEATVKDLVHANKVLSTAKAQALQDDQKLIFRPFKARGPARLDLSWGHRKKGGRQTRDHQRQSELGMAAV